ncbi:E3 ubiquitin-protein ligase FANCL-like isoform X2 [Tubulanus polymorphus]|uniref:E3 ubiquitin-protein ligase FANCL-like isoform X2 n=1 Tax=Tubulanus polymorphus TaxID=672921 RepID=UPI003DA518D1
MEVQAICPLLLPQNVEKTQYSGFLCVSGSYFQVHFSYETDNLRHLKMTFEWQLDYILRDSRDVIKKRLEECQDLAAFLVELKSIIANCLGENNKTQTKIPPASFYKSLIVDIEEIGWDKLVYVDPDFKDIHLMAKDSRNVRHVIEISVNSRYPADSPTWKVDLPSRFEPKFRTEDLYSLFKFQLSQYEEFWKMVEEIDKNTWVLEPEKPTPASTKRRIALGNNVSIQIDIDPRQPRSLPEFMFLGPEHGTSPLRNALNRNIEKWDPNTPLLENLKSVLDVDFPSPSNSKKEDFSVECGICYTYRLNENIPEQACLDSRCGQPFHRSCLYEWLKALPSCRQSFNVVFGECPYCSVPITVKMPP